MVESRALEKRLMQERTMPVKLVLRNKEFEVKAGMALLDALKKCSIIPESVIATRNGELITEDEILKDGDVVKLVAVISGGSDEM
jgi:thiamine biosynthesis protein ThiS